MKKRNKKRYYSEEQIHAEIDELKRKARELNAKAEALDLAADELFKVPELAEDAIFKREMAKKARRSAQRLEHEKLKHLKYKLSEFRTLPLPGMETDSISG